MDELSEKHNIRGTRTTNNSFKNKNRNKITVFNFFSKFNPLN